MSLTALLASGLSTPLINGLIPLALGIYATLAGLGIIPASFSDPKKASRWVARWGRQARIGGPLLIVLGLILTVRAL